MLRVHQRSPAVKQADSQGWGGGHELGLGSWVDLGEESARPKAGHHGAWGQHRAPWPPLPIQRPPSETAMRPRLPPPPTKSVALPTGPSGVGFWWKRGEWREERVRAPSSQASAQGPPPVSLRGGAAVWQPAVPSAHLRCANQWLGLGPWGPGVAAGTPPHGPPPRSPSVSPQVSCSYVGCGESFADHSTLHAQVSVGPELRPQLQLPPGSTRLSGPRRLCV